jgi:Iap family predicted aminopeptidase
MFDKEKIKIKYIIGTYKDELNFPTIEDFEYLIKNWYWNEGGHHFIHSYRAIEETGNLVFTDVVLKEKLDGDEESANRLIESLQESGRIKLNKATKFTNYFELM